MAAAVLIGYLLGSVPVAVMVGRRLGIDPRQVGDRNPGYWNVKEQLGRSASLPVFVGDTAKGALAGAAGLLLDGGWGVPYVAVGAAMVGHAFPLFAGFRGGRSILAFTGGMVVVEPVAAAIAIGALAIVWIVTRRFDLAARVGVFGFPVALALVQPKERVAAAGALMAIIGLRFAQATWADRRSPSAQ